MPPQNKFLVRQVYQCNLYSCIYTLIKTNLSYDIADPPPPLMSLLRLTGGECCLKTHECRRIIAWNILNRLFDKKLYLIKNT